MSRQAWSVGIIIAFCASGLFDLATFLFTNKAFETNPLFILTKSVFFMIVIKLAVMYIIVRWLAKDWPFNKSGHVTMFSMTFAATIATFAQTLGGISNLRMIVENPPVSAAMPPEQAVATYVVLSLYIILIPYVISIISFFLWNKAYHDCPVKVINSNYWKEVDEMAAKKKQAGKKKCAKKKVTGGVDVDIEHVD